MNRILDIQTLPLPPFLSINLRNPSPVHLFPVCPIQLPEKETRRDRHRRGRRSHPLGAVAVRQEPLI
jgi:hypothetical protein